MQKYEIESLPEVIQAAKVLRELELRGLKEPVIASGWIRSFLMDIPPSDIDVSYVGPVHFAQAQEYLADALSKLHLNPEPWDVAGIWNAEIANPLITRIEQHLLRDYVCSIDSVYLASDGRLHDTTGFGLLDAQSRTLRLNDMEVGPPRSAKAKVYIFLEGCRRMARFGWIPTPETSNAISGGVIEWDNLDEKAVDYFIRRLRKKYDASEYEEARAAYEKYGWGFVFDII